MLSKSIVFAVSLLVLLLHADCFGLPASDVQVITDREYFEVVQTCFKEAQSSIKVMMFEASYYEKYPGSPTNVLIRELIAAHKRGVARFAIVLDDAENSRQFPLDNLPSFFHRPLDFDVSITNFINS